MNASPLLLIGDCGFQRWSLLRDTLKSKFSVTKGTLQVAMRLADGSRLEHKFPSPTPVKVCDFTRFRCC